MNDRIPSSARLAEYFHPAYYLYMVGLVSLMFYGVFYTHAPDLVIIVLQVIYSGCFIAFGGYGTLKKFGSLSSSLIIILACIVPVGILFSDSTPIYGEILRTFLGILVLSYAPETFSNNVRNRGLRYLAWLLAIMIALFAVFAFTGPSVVIRTARLATVLGDPGSVHPSAYFVLGLGLIAWSLTKRRVMPRWLGWLSIGTAGVLIAFYQVRTTWLMLAAMAFYATYRAAIQKYGSRWFFRSLSAAGLVIALGVSLFVTLQSENIYDIGAGRGGTYAYRLQIISERPAVNALFGTGPGTDRFKGIYTWKSDEKDSHNDYLSTAIEQGVVGLLVVLATLATIFFRERRVIYTSSIVLALALGSAVSNSALFRPNIAPLYVAAILLYPMPKRIASARARV